MIESIFITGVSFFVLLAVFYITEKKKYFLTNDWDGSSKSFYRKIELLNLINVMLILFSVIISFIIYQFDFQNIFFDKRWSEIEGLTYFGLFCLKFSFIILIVLLFRNISSVVESNLKSFQRKNFMEELIFLLSCFLIFFAMVLFQRNLVSIFIFLLIMSLNGNFLLHFRQVAKPV